MVYDKIHFYVVFPRMNKTEAGPLALLYSQTRLIAVVGIIFNYNFKSFCSPNQSRGAVVTIYECFASKIPPTTFDFREFCRTPYH